MGRYFSPNIFPQSRKAELRVLPPDLAQDDDDSGADVANSIFLPEQLRISGAKPLGKKK